MDYGKESIFELTDEDWENIAKSLKEMYQVGNGYSRKDLENAVKKLASIPDQVNHPTHYTQFTVECFDMMLAIWGAEKVATYCEINAFKYKIRAGYKDDESKDLAKSRWYLEKAKELRKKNGA